MSLGWVDTHHFSLVKDFEVNQTQRESTRIDLHDFHIFTSFYFLVSHIPYLINLTLFHPLSSVISGGMYLLSSLCSHHPP